MDTVYEIPNTKESPPHFRQRVIRRGRHLHPDRHLYFNRSVPQQALLSQIDYLERACHIEYAICQN